MDRVLRAFMHRRRRNRIKRLCSILQSLYVVLLSTFTLVIQTLSSWKTSEDMATAATATALSQEVGESIPPNTAHVSILEYS